MISLGKELQRTIRNLEMVRDSQHPPAEGLIEALNTLYVYQYSLVDEAIDRSTAEYQSAARAIRKAAKETRMAIVELQRVEKALALVDKAVRKIGKLLSSSGLF